MNTQEQRLFRIGSYRVDLDLNRVARSGGGFQQRLAVNDAAPGTNEFAQYHA